MKINFKQSKYVLPIIFIPFICIFFYVYQSRASKPVVEETPEGLQESLADVSGNVKETSITNKLDAFRNQYKEADGATAIGAISTDQSMLLDESMMDSVDQEYMNKFGSGYQAPTRVAGNRSTGSSYTPSAKTMSKEDAELARALNELSRSSSSPISANYDSKLSYQNEQYVQEKDQDPMEVFRQQMAYMDSVSKANDPDYIAEQKKIEAMEQAEKALANTPKLAVDKVDATPRVFNTVRKEQEESFVKAIIDENVQGYAGSRIRLRLLDDVNVGGHLVKKGTYIYAQISSFSEQRVGLSVVSIIKENKIFPVSLEVYDLDGMQGLYVPDSEFREFSKQLGNRSMQGINMESDPENTSQFIMSSMQKVFTSTSSAIANLIRKNKAKIKYNTFIYLIDSKELQNQQRKY